MWLVLLAVLMAVNENSISPNIMAENIIGHTGTVFRENAGLKSDSCTICHNDGGFDLSATTNQLCYHCHNDVESKSLKRFKHADVVNPQYPSVSCEGCHKLHKAGARPLLTQNEMELCQGCHPETKQYLSHPVVTGLQGQTITGSDGRVITCASHCHDVHGTDNKYFCQLEPGRELCISCHKDFE
jgi:predicted CXXCH cytochrome family protein